MTTWYDRGTSNNFGNRKISIVVEYIIKCFPLCHV